MKPVAYVEAGAQWEAMITPSWMIMFADSNSGLNSSWCRSRFAKSAGAQVKMPRSCLGPAFGPFASEIQYSLPSTKLMPPDL